MTKEIEMTDSNYSVFLKSKNEFKKMSLKNLIENIIQEENLLDHDEKQ